MTWAAGYGLEGEGDRRVLEFAASLRLVTVGQVARLLGDPRDEACSRLAGLERTGVLARERVAAETDGLFRITGAGLRAIGSRLPAPAFDPRVRQAVGVGWLLLVLRDGRLRAGARVLSERQMRVEELAGALDAPFAARPDLFGGRGSVHYPDLMVLVGRSRVAVELLLVTPVARELEAVLRAYAADARIDTVVCCTPDPWLAGLVKSVAGSLELAGFVEVRPVTAGSLG